MFAARNRVDAADAIRAPSARHHRVLPAPPPGGQVAVGVFPSTRAMRPADVRARAGGHVSKSWQATTCSCDGLAGRLLRRNGPARLARAAPRSRRKIAAPSNSLRRTSIDCSSATSSSSRSFQMQHRPRNEPPPSDHGRSVSLQASMGEAVRGARALRSAGRFQIRPTPWSTLLASASGALVARIAGVALDPAPFDLVPPSATNCRVAAASSTFLTAAWSDVRQPLAFQPRIHSVMPMRTYQLSR